MLGIAISDRRHLERESLRKLAGSEVLKRREGVVGASDNNAQCPWSAKKPGVALVFPGAYNGRS
ncbi:MAG: hypothetical protein CM1200mP36_01530 [Gammaproteobacteria bacterium]|nr:MAG: hypothetical protein CM1200mP36_01530 [Gammaproteobacteria bacterium]